MEVQQMSNSSTVTEADLIEPIHPGAILMEVFIEDFGITQNKLAVSIGGHIRPSRVRGRVSSWRWRAGNWSMPISTGRARQHFSPGSDQRTEFPTPW
ncbi:hypothetical protein NCCP2495_18290 [Dietzia sp. NCCP-2495]|nr:hypothetical protein NCCP2495_18290 [Dietzia sp. NCCP-2495]